MGLGTIRPSDGPDKQAWGYLSAASIAIGNARRILPENVWPQGDLTVIEEQLTEVLNSLETKGRHARPTV